MSSATVSSDLRQGIASARAGHRLLARLHLAQAIDADPANDAHWLWMAWVAESPAAAVAHLEQALEHNPGNEIARAGLTWARTMAEWDFERPLSPRATLAAVAEREAAPAPAPARAAKKEPFNEQAPPASEPAASLADIDVEPEPEPVAAAAPAPALEAVAPQAAAPEEPVDQDRPESIPIDKLTGMFLGEGKQLQGGEFAGFNMGSSAIDAINDPSASLATPFPGGVTVGKLSPIRPPSADLGTPFGNYAPPEEADPLEATSESEFETLNPTNMPAPPVAETPSDPAPPPSTPSFVELTPSLAETPPVPEAAAADAAPRKVLIVDDSPTVCKIVSITLKKRGYEVQSAGDGVEAMSLIAADQPDLILLDITMPRMDGYQLCKLIKGYPQTKNIPVVMLSGKDGFFDRVRGKLVGCSDYVTKPFDPELLVATVERFLPTGAPAPAAVAAAT